MMKRTILASVSVMGMALAEPLIAGPVTDADHAQ